MLRENTQKLGHRMKMEYKNDEENRNQAFVQRKIDDKYSLDRDTR